MKILLCFFLISLGCLAQNPFTSYMEVFDSKKYEYVDVVKTYAYTSENLQYFLSHGYTVKGRVAFRSTYAGKKMAQDAARNCGASILLYKDNFVGTETGTKVIPWLNVGETYTVNKSTDGEINLNGGSNTIVVGSNGYGVGNTDVYGSGKYSEKTTTTIKAPDYYTIKEIPYSKDYYDQYAIFLVFDLKAYNSSYVSNVEIKMNQMDVNGFVPILKNPVLNEKELIGFFNPDSFKIIESYNSEFYKVSSSFKGYGYVSKKLINK